MRGPAAQFQTLFKTQLNNYRAPDGQEFYSASVEPTIPDPIAAKVTGVIGLTNSLQYAPLAKVHQAFGEDPIAPEIGTDTAGGTGPGGAYSPSDLRSVYKIPKFGDVAPQTVAVFEQNGFYPSDVQKYLERMQLPNRPVKFVGVNGYNGSVDRNNASVELQAVLDIELVIGINPGVKEVLVYEDGTDPFAVALIDALDKVASDNKAAILSISYGLDEVTQGDSQLAAENTALTQLAAQGITVLACSGNGGAYGQTGTSVYPAQLEVTDPGAQPLVTCVGATNLSTGPHEVRLAEAVWDRLGLFSGGGASGGGFSSYWPIPSWQAPSYVTTNGGSSTYRNVPDVAAVGDPFTGVAAYSKMNGGWLQMGGTGVSTPLWAGYISILNAGLEYVTGNRLGFFNPTFYNTDNIVNGPLLYSVIDGTNGDSSMYGTPGYNAGFGYNNCTGAGTIFGGGFGVQILSSVTGGRPPGYSRIFDPTLTDTSAAFHWTSVIGLTNSVQYAPLAKVYQTFGEDAATPDVATDTAGGTGPGGAYAPSDLRTVYKIPKFGDVAPQTVAVFEQNGFYPSDVQKYLERMQLPNRPVKFIGVNGYNGSVDRKNASVELQAVLDIELVIGINPGVKEVLVYEDGTDPFAVAIIDALDKVASDNKAAILSISYGLDEVTQGDSQLAAENTALTQLAAQGITVLACSGNGGAYGQTGTSVYPAQLEVTDPGAQPLVTCVGATNLSTGPHEVRLAEAVWDRLGLFSGGGTSGGGFSSYWTIPSWQAPSYVTTNGGSPSYRNVPDVAAVGDPFTGVAAYSKMNGGWLQMGGTGVSAPLWAGYISILNAGLEYVTGNRLGFFNPTFYNTNNIVNGPLLYSVIDGTNGDSSMYGTPGYNAGFGYNNCTGAGTIFGGGFGVQILSSETGGTPPGYSRVFDPTLTDTSAAFHWTKGKGATGYVIGLFLPQHDFFECFVTKETNITFKDLLPKSQYHFSVYGVNKGGATWDGFLFTTK